MSASAISMKMRDDLERQAERVSLLDDSERGCKCGDHDGKNAGCLAYVRSLATNAIATVIASPVKRAFLVLAGLFFIAWHHVFHRGHWAGNPHWSPYLWLESNGTMAAPPASIVLHYDAQVIDADTLSLRFHKYERPDSHDAWWSMTPESGEDDANKGEGHFTRCEPDNARDGVAVFGTSCVDVMMQWEDAPAGDRLIYALIAYGKKFGADSGDPDGVVHIPEEGDEERRHERIEEEERALFHFWWTKQLGWRHKYAALVQTIVLHKSL
ncbi:hypothetical protein BC830DRAFT_1117261 [Chytriomyces sp. MP71]|nr:hypothetical protein BC830DRAFT_1117261 [Chytriomyces sp. MP71]